MCTKLPPPVISVIIPVYNGSKTILRCLDSIWKQNLPNDKYEVICVDDCSTDNTINILEIEQKKYSQLRVLKNKHNLRAGGARNHGVREANGKFIVFIDADDYYNNDSLLFAYNYQNKYNLDILMLDYSRQYSTNDNICSVHNFPNESIMRGVDFIKTNGCPYSPWKFIFRRDLMVNNNIWFEENCCCEDVDWCFRLVLHANTIQYKNKVLNCVIINEGSQTAVEHKSFKTVSDKLFAGYRLKQLLNNPKYCNDSKLSSYIKSVSNLYLYEGTKYMTACKAPTQDKVKTIKKYITEADNLPRTVSFAFQHPTLFACLTNISALVVPYIITLKRKLVRR